MQQPTPNNRDYSTISPSAKMLLLLKGHTTLPFARETAELVTQPEKYDAGNPPGDMVTRVRLLHFEERYTTIDGLLQTADATNILELSSGFSFRGLDVVSRNNVHYIDTDLPEMTATKQELVAALKEKTGTATIGQLEILPLNALDRQQFADVVNRFEEGPVTIVNEGLLMYLSTAEKEQLCSTIHHILKERGGCWITGDAYKRPPQEYREQAKNNNPDGDNTSDFFEQHKVYDNMFESFEEAEALFNRMGLYVDEVAQIDTLQLSCIQYFPQEIVAQMKENKEQWKMRHTWKLVAR
jgi:O-methyltransferase involved in polyketide biosynthesis